MKSIRLIILITIINSGWVAVPVQAHAQTDSLIFDTDVMEQDLYEINLIKFKRALLSDPPDSSIIPTIRDLTTEFLNLAKQKEYADANIILESVLLIFTTWNESSSDYSFASFDEAASKGRTSSWQWTRELTIGSDIWQQQFEFSIPELDSTIVEKQVNPLVGCRLGLQWAGNQQSAKTNAEFRTSRDYSMANWYTCYNQRIWTIWELEFDNRLESTRYVRDIDLAYTQNQASLQFATKSTSAWSLDLQDEWRIRRNKPHSFYYADYQHNQLRGALQYSSPTGWLSSITTEWDSRFHDKYIEKDYQELSFTAYGYSMPGTAWNINGNAEYRNRNYQVAWNDSTYYNDYAETDIQLNCEYRFHSKLQAELDYQTAWRRYNNMNSVTLNFNDHDLRSLLHWQIHDSWSMSVGYVFQSRAFEQPNTGILSEQDYYANGIEISMDVFKLNAIMLSFTDTFLWKRYPNSAANDIEGFTLYTDRNINTLLCFFSWTINSNLQMHLTANYDFDRDPYDDHSDTQTTMGAAEFVYSF
ncbi:hypothetical protein JW960_15790 [candidate division KSB1 bacterium]|nr:hypothetical protein [candidate division KSB1 bacterium]